MRFDLSSATSLTVRGLEPSAHAYVRHELDPFEPTDATGPADVAIVQGDGESPPCQELQGDAGDGWTCGWKHDRLVLCGVDGTLELPPRLAAVPGELRRYGAFPLWRAFAQVVRPSLALAAVARGTATAHAAAVTVDGSGVLIGGWSESGKTEAALGLMEQGAGFVSDKWTFVAGDGSLGTFPVRASIRHWVLRYLPRLRQALALRARAQLAVARPLAGIVRSLSRRADGPITGRVTGAGARAVEMAERVALGPSEIASAYGQARGPRAERCGAAFMLCTTRGGRPSVRPADPAWMATRFTRSAAFERRTLTGLAQRASVFDPAALEAIDHAHRREHELLEAAMSRIPTTRIDIPFPCDPRLLARLIAAQL